MEPPPDQEDARLFDFFKKRNSSKTDGKNVSKNGASASSNLPTGPSIFAEEYDMNHSKRGKAVIFNHITFKNGQSPRFGAQQDAIVLREEFGRLQFDVKIHTNKTKKEIFSVLEEVSTDTDSDVDCLVVIVMTHGDPNQLSAYDTDYRSNKLWEGFTADKCKSLAGKPKLFFIQACRGVQVDSGVQLAVRPYTQTDSSPRITYTIPTMADILIANATYDGSYSYGHFAWRNADTGSWFIQALCHELAVSGEKKEICQILTRVNRRVAVHYASHVPDDKARNQKKQMPNFLSTLTRDLYFRRKVLNTSI